MKSILSLLLYTLLLNSVYTQNNKLEVTALRTGQAPVIDGILDDLVWSLAIPMTNFTQYDPYQETKPSFQTKVMIAYNDEAIFIAAMMYDSSPDSILKQLGDRDDELNADDIVFQFDPFNNNQDAYYFRVTASNVQSEWRERDASFNAVWMSKTAIHADGWSVEVKIPFSAIRIPPVSEHAWALQITRNIRRYRELSKWAPETKGVDNEMIFWGLLKGLNNIEPPVRLSLTPYLSVFTEIRSSNYPVGDRFSITPVGGLDLKYGINESFTFDLTLLPDFSQIKSDDVVKNLSAFEINFSEQRPFFLESMDLFKLGGLFYSRRIGKIPSAYYSAEEQVGNNEELISNPASVNLINAFKITGQTQNGMSVGIMNAITDRVQSEIREADGSIRIFQTEPMANYNILVFRQAMKNNSSVYLINTNLMREGKNTSANVTGSGLKLYNASNKYALTLNGSVSVRAIETTDISIPNFGMAWNGMIAKVRGRFQMHVYHQMKNELYNINDMGLNYTNDEVHNEMQMAYRFFDPMWKLLRLNFTGYIWKSERISTNQATSQGISLNIMTTTFRHLSLWTNSSYEFKDMYDYYEPRTNGYFYIKPSYIYTLFGFSSDYRRPFALDGTVSYTNRPENHTQGVSGKLNPIFRVSDHFECNYYTTVSASKNSFGFAGTDTSGVPVFGRRDVTTVENAFSGKYMFRNNLSLHLRVRHYWSKGKYNQFFDLQQNGLLETEPSSSLFDDFNFNSFHVDLAFNWEFAPGSNLTMVWKNSIVDEEAYVIYGFIDNLSHTFEKPQLNMFSLKFIYYLDYHTLKQQFKS